MYNAIEWNDVNHNKTSYLHNNHHVSFGVVNYWISYL